jgi:membrane protease YdiL (CAAX protease family)
MTVFLNPDNELRTGWKFAAYTLLFLIIWVAAGILLQTIFFRAAVPYTPLAILALNASASFIPAVSTMIFMARFVDHAPVALYGIALHENWRSDLLLGVIIAAGMLAVLLMSCLILGGVHIKWVGGQAAAGSLGVTLLFLIIAAANEELMFRGYPLQILMRGIGPWPATLTMSLIFGLLHLSNPSASWTSLFNTVLAGIMLSVAYFKTRSLWLPFGIHGGWNVGLGFVFGFPLSGIHIDSLWTSSASIPAVLGGGNYGPEGGLLCMIIFVAAAVVVWVLRGADISPKLRALLLTNARKIYVSEH